MFTIDLVIMLNFEFVADRFNYRGTWILNFSGEENETYVGLEIIQ